MFMPALGLIRRMGRPGTIPTDAKSAGVLARLVAWLRTELRYRRALATLNRLDDRDLDDLALGRGDLPALAWRHAHAA